MKTGDFSLRPPSGLKMVGLLLCLLGCGLQYSSDFAIGAPVPPWVRVRDGRVEVSSLSFLLYCFRTEVFKLWPFTCCGTSHPINPCKILTAAGMMGWMLETPALDPEVQWMNMFKREQWRWLTGRSSDCSVCGHEIDSQV